MLCVAMRRIEKNAEGYKIVLANGQQRPKICKESLMMNGGNVKKKRSLGLGPSS
jgi:hypothetical protein